MILEETKKEICNIGKRMYENGFVAANDGNISVKINDRILITPTGVSKGYMSPEMMILVDLDGKQLEGERRPSSEIKMHLQVYKEDENVKSVVHAHPPFATSYAVAGKELHKKIMPETIISLGSVPLAKYGTPSTSEIPKSIKGLIKQNNALLLENHGALTWGDSLKNAYFKMETLEFYAKILTITENITGNQEISTNDIKKLIQTFNLKG